MWFLSDFFELIFTLVTGKTIDEMFDFIIDSGIIYKYIPLAFAVIVVSRIIVHIVLYFKLKK